MSVGARIREARKKNRLSQDDVADKIGVTQNAVSSWERDRTEPDLATINRIAKALGVPVVAILSDSEEPYGFGKRLFDLMNALGVSVETLAEKAGCPRSHLKSWLDGSAFPAPAIIERIASALGVRVSDLTEDTHGGPHEPTDNVCITGPRRPENDPGTPAPIPFPPPRLLNSDEQALLDAIRSSPSPSALIQALLAVVRLQTGSSSDSGSGGGNTEEVKKSRVA